MKKSILTFIAFTVMANISLADCDYSKIQKVEGGYLYTKELHLCVGEMKQDLDIANQQKEKLIKAINFKDLAIAKADQRADMWMNTSLKLEDRINKIDSIKTNNQYLYFGLGVLTMFAAGYMAGQIYKR